MKKIMILAAAFAAAVIGMTSCSSSKAFEQEAYYKAFEKEAVVETPAEAVADEVDEFVPVDQEDEAVKEISAMVAELPETGETIYVDGDGTLVVDKAGSAEVAAGKARKLATRVVKDVEYVQDAKTGEVIGENVIAEKNLNGVYAFAEGMGIYFNDRPNFGGGAGIGVSTPHWDVSAAFGAAASFKNKDDVNAGQSILSWYAHAGAMYCIDITPRGRGYFGPTYGKWQVKLGVEMFFYRRQLEEDISPDIIVDEGVDIEVVKVKSSTAYHRGFTFAPCAKFAIDGRLTYNLHLQASVFAGPTSEYFKGGSRGRWCGGANVSLICYFNKWHKVKESTKTSAQRVSQYNNDRINQMRASQRR